MKLALTIILEHSFFLWDQRKSKDCVAAAITHYKASPNCNAAMQAVDAAINAVGGDNYTGSMEALGKNLVQIALSNRLCKSHSQPWH